MLGQLSKNENSELSIVSSAYIRIRRSSLTHWNTVAGKAFFFLFISHHLEFSIFHSFFPIFQIEQFTWTMGVVQFLIARNVCKFVRFWCMVWFRCMSSRTKQYRHATKEHSSTVRLLRRIKAEVEKSLLPKIELKLFVGLTPLQHETYKKVLMKEVKKINEYGQETNKAINMILMELRKEATNINTWKM